MRIMLAILIVLLLSAGACFAEQSVPSPLNPSHVVVMADGAPANWAMLPWADTVLHTDPVLPKGIAPVQVTAGYELLPLSESDRDSRVIDFYVGKTQSRHGKWVWMRIRPGESSESAVCGTRHVELDGQTYIVETMSAKRYTRCGNPGPLTWFKWTRVETKPGPTVYKRFEVEVQGPERIVFKRFEVETRVEVPFYVLPALPAETLATPHSSRRIFVDRGILPNLLGVAQAFVGRTRINVTATGGNATQSQQQQQQQEQNQQQQQQQDQDQDQATTVNIDP